MLCFRLALPIAALLLFDNAAFGLDADRFCAGRAGDYSVMDDLALPIGPLRLAISKKVACPGPNRFDAPAEAHFLVQIGDPRNPSAPPIQRDLGPGSPDGILVTVPDGQIFLTHREMDRRETIGIAEPTPAGMAVTPVAVADRHPAVVPVWGESAKTLLSPLYPETGIEVTGSRWLDVGEGRIVDMKARRVLSYGSRTATDLTTFRLLGVTRDGRTLAWIGAYRGGGFALVLSDLDRGSGAFVQYRLDDLLSEIGIAEDGPDFAAITPAWTSQHFLITSKPEEPLRLERRVRDRVHEPPRFVKSHDDNFYSLACVDADALGPLLLAGLKADWHGDPGPDGDQPFIKSGDAKAVFACGETIARTAALREHSWDLAIEGYSFWLSTNDHGGVSFMCLGRVGAKSFEIDDWGEALTEAIATYLSQKLREPALARYLNRS